MNIFRAGGGETRSKVLIGLIVLFKNYRWEILKRNEINFPPVSMLIFLINQLCLLTLPPIKDIHPNFTLQKNFTKLFSSIIRFVIHFANFKIVIE